MDIRKQDKDDNEHRPYLKNLLTNEHLWFQTLFFFLYHLPQPSIQISSTYLKKHHGSCSRLSSSPLLSLNESPLTEKIRSSLTARTSPCHVSNSHSLLNSTIWFYDHQPRDDTWLLEIVTLGKIGLHKKRAPNGGLQVCWIFFVLVGEEIGDLYLVLFKA